MSKIAYHAINQTGLGHAMRLLAVATAVRAAAPETHQLFATDAHIPDYLKQCGFPSVILPLDDTGPYAGFDRRARSVPKTAVRTMLYHVLKSYGPHATVFDTHFSGRLTERLAGEGMSVALVLRKARASYLETLINEYNLQCFQRILVPHTDVDFASDLPPPLVRRLERLANWRYVGPIAKSADVADLARCTAAHGIADRETIVLITGGSGGYDAYHERYMQVVCEAAAILKRDTPGVRILVTSGPYGKIRKDLFPPEVEVLGWCADLALLMFRADLVISQGGYNSIMEIWQAGARACVAAAPRLHEDQSERLVALAERGAFAKIDLEQHPAELAAVMATVLSQPKQPRRPAKGAELAAATLLELIPRTSIERMPWNALDKLQPLKGWNFCVDLGEGAASELAGRLNAVLARVDAAGLPREALTLHYLDRHGGAQVVELLSMLGATRFGTLVARVQAGLSADRASSRSIAWDTYRKLQPPFKLDITPADDPRLSVSWP